MSRFHSYLNTAITIIELAEKGNPLSLSLKKFFSSHPQMGARDRRFVSSLCYHYFRCFFAFQNQTISQAIIKSSFICTNSASDFLALHAPDLNPHTSKSIEQKCSLLGMELIDFFPFGNFAGGQIDLSSYIKSLLVQPDSFLRIRPGKHQQVFDALKKSDILFSEISPDAIRFSAGQSVDKAITPDRDAVIQDYSSQQVFNWLQQHPHQILDKNLQVWDCCAASGGKSILLFDQLKIKPKITVSDIRKSVIHNLRERFGRARIPLQRVFTADLTEKITGLNNERFDVIIADVPCTGSGTWARAPEQMAWFKKEDLAAFRAKQIAIVKNAIPYLEKNGLLFYITCSVFSDENERVVECLCQSGLKLLDSNYICGYNGMANTMFSAVLINSD